MVSCSPQLEQYVGVQRVLTAYDTFEKKIVWEKKYFKESCRPSADQHFSFMYITKNAFV